MHRIPLRNPFTIPARLLAPGLLALACGACGPVPPPDDPVNRSAASESARNAGGTAPADAGPADPGAAGGADSAAGDTAATRYACDDGSTVEVAIAAGQASVRLADGRTVVLPKAESASKGGDAAYVGEAMSLQAGANGVLLHQDEGAARLCRPASG